MPIHDGMDRIQYSKTQHVSNAGVCHLHTLNGWWKSVKTKQMRRAKGIYSKLSRAGGGGVDGHHPCVWQGPKGRQKSGKVLYGEREGSRSALMEAVSGARLEEAA